MDRCQDNDNPHEVFLTAIRLVPTVTTACFMPMGTITSLRGLFPCATSLSFRLLFALICVYYHADHRSTRTSPTDKSACLHIEVLEPLVVVRC